jgi:hypothetical protein
MISEASARRRTLIALVVCVAVAAIGAWGWVRLIYPSFCGGAYSDFKLYPHVLFLPASLVAFVVSPSDAGLRKALFCEAFLICLFVLFFIYLFIAYAWRKNHG